MIEFKENCGFRNSELVHNMRLFTEAGTKTTAGQLISFALNSMIPLHINTGASRI